jgi:opacity protein-like surface antigen
MKNMKKLLFGTIVTMFTISSLQSTAQMKKGAYVGVNVGYNAAAGAANFEDFQNITQTATTTSETENIKLSLGKGISAGINVGYMFNENIGLELGVQYLLGGKTKASDKELDGDYTTNTLSSKIIQFKPSVVIATNMKNFTPYAKFGAVIGSGKVLSEFEDKSGTFIDIANTEFKKGLAIGFNAAIGVNFPINKNLSFSAEVNTVNMQYSPKKASITKYTENGVDKLSTLSVSQKEIEFEKKLTRNFTTPTPTTSPRQQAAISMPFGSIGINVGVKYSF